MKELKYINPREMVAASFLVHTDPLDKESAALQFNSLKEVPREEVFKAANAYSVLANWSHFAAALQESGIQKGSPWLDITIEHFLQEDEAFLKWLPNLPVPFTFFKRCHPETGKRQWCAEVTNPEFTVKLYDDNLASLCLRTLYSQLRPGMIRINRWTRTMYIDKWLIVNEFESLEEMQEAFPQLTPEAFQAALSAEKDVASDEASAVKEEVADTEPTEAGRTSAKIAINENSDNATEIVEKVSDAFTESHVEPTQSAEPSTTENQAPTSE